MSKYFVIILFSISAAHGARMTFNELLNKIKTTNQEVKFQENKVHFSKEKIRSSKSDLWPKLTASLTANEGKKTSAASAVGTSGSAISTISSATGATGSDEITQDGWSAGATLSYNLFSKFQVDTNIKNAKIQKDNDLRRLSAIKIQKQAKLAQLILEINGLLDIQKVLDKAHRLIRKIKRYSKNKKIKYIRSTEHDLKKEELFAEIDFNQAKVKNALEISTQGMVDLIPEFDERWIHILPLIRVDYPLKDYSYHKEKYLSDGLEIKNFNADIKSLENVYRSTDFEKPWIPYVTLSATYTQNGKFSGDDNSDDNWRATLLFSFNLFDGFYTSARRGQVRYSLKMANNRKKIQMSKSLVSLRNSYYSAKRYKAEHDYHKAQANIKRNKFVQLKKVGRSGVSLVVERSAIQLEVAKLEWSALEALKSYQQSILTVAEKTNEFDEVNINENI